MTAQWAETYPDVAATWHPSRNGDLDASQTGAAGGGHVWWRCPAGHEWQEQISIRLALPQWKNGDRAACRECAGNPLTLLSYTYPECGHTRRITLRNRDKNPPRCWPCEKRLRDQAWRKVARIAREAGPEATELVAAIERDYLSPDVPAPLAWEFRRHAMKLMQGAIGAEQGRVKPHTVADVTGQLRGEARALPPSVEAAAEACETGRGVLKILDQAHWAAGWLYHLTGRALRPAVDAEATITALRSYVEAVPEAVKVRDWGTKATTGILTDRLREAATQTSAARKDPFDAPSIRACAELRIPVLTKETASRYGRLDLVIWQSQAPDIVIEIDSAPNSASARKLEFARDAGAVPVWVRFGSGSVTAPDGVSVIDLR